MQPPHFIINIPPTNNTNKSQILNPSENIVENISFHSVAIGKLSKPSDENFNQKWVLGKLIEMECQQIEEIKKTLPEINQNQQTKEELLSVCLDIVTNQSMNKEKSILGKIYDESKEFIKNSMKSLIVEHQAELKTNEILSKSLNGETEKKLGELKVKNKSLIIQNSPIFELKNDCELILFSENSITEKTHHKKAQEKKSPPKEKEDILLSSQIHLQEETAVKMETSQIYLHEEAIKIDVSEVNAQNELEKTNNNNIEKNIVSFKNETNQSSFMRSFRPETGKRNDENIDSFHLSELMKENLDFSLTDVKKDINLIITELDKNGKSPTKISHILPKSSSFSEESPQIRLNQFHARLSLLGRRDSLEILKGLVKENPKIKKKQTKDSKENKAEDFKSCEICFDVVPKSKQRKAGKCDDIFCKTCMKSYLIESIKAGRVLEIPCPKEGCKYKYMDEEIKNVLKKNPEMIRKYEKFKLQITLSKDPSIRWCIRPDCDNYMRGSLDKPKLICACGEVICFNCSRKWHEGQTCVELMDKEYENYRAKMNIIDCPKCKSRIEKISGCNHMTCTRCRYEFCWVCGGKYSKRHFKKLNIFGCPGMMYQNVQRDKNLKKKLIMARFLTVFKILATILLICLLPLLGLLYLIWIPNYFHFQNRRPRFDCPTICSTLFFLILGIVLLPITLALSICPGFCILILRNKISFGNGMRRRR